jgi:hypothetical protein
MKANLYSLILFFFLTAGTPVAAQPATVVVSGYYTVNDYHFSSRINRFHKSYAEFSYYSPVFTDTYWYSYSPFTRGVSIYGGGAVGIGYSGYYPVYDYYDGWYDPYYGYSSYWGYQPVYYSWFAPVFVNVNRAHYYPDQFWYGNTYRQRNTTNVYNITNNYYSSPSSRRGSYSGNYGVSRRESTPVSSASNSSGSRRVQEPTRPTGSRSSAGRDSGRDVSNSGGRLTPGNSGNNGNNGNNANNGNNGNNGNENNGNHYGNVNNDGNPNTVNNSENNRNNPERERVYNPGNSNRNEGIRTRESGSNQPVNAQPRSSSVPARSGSVTRSSRSSSVDRGSGSQSSRSGSVQKRSASSGSQATKSNSSSDSPSSTSSGSSRRRK